MTEKDPPAPIEKGSPVAIAGSIWEQIRRAVSRLAPATPAPRPLTPGPVGHDQPSPPEVMFPPPPAPPIPGAPPIPLPPAGALPSIPTLPRPIQPPADGETPSTLVSASEAALQTAVELAMKPSFQPESQPTGSTGPGSIPAARRGRTRT